MSFTQNNFPMKMTKIEVPDKEPKLLPFLMDPISEIFRMPQSFLAILPKHKSELILRLDTLHYRTFGNVPSVDQIEDAYNQLRELSPMRFDYPFKMEWYETTDPVVPLKGIWGMPNEPQPKFVGCIHSPLTGRQYYVVDYFRAESLKAKLMYQLVYEYRDFVLAYFMARIHYAHNETEIPTEYYVRYLVAQAVVELYHNHYKPEQVDNHFYDILPWAFIEAIGNSLEAFDMKPERDVSDFVEDVFDCAQDLRFFKEALITLPTDDSVGWLARKAAMINKLMHSINGNIQVFETTVEYDPKIKIPPYWAYISVHEVSRQLKVQIGSDGSMYKCTVYGEDVRITVTNAPSRGAAYKFAGYIYGKNWNDTAEARRKRVEDYINTVTAMDLPVDLRHAIVAEIARIEGVSIVKVLKSEAEKRNKTMHSINGNSAKPGSQKKPLEKKKQVKKAVKKEVKKELKNPVRYIEKTENHAKRMVASGLYPNNKITSNAKSAMAKFIMLPATYSPVRWGDTYSGTLTSVAKPTSVETIPWDTGAATTTLGNPEDQYLFLRRSVMHNSIAKCTNKSGLSQSYQAYFNAGETNVAPTTTAQYILLTSEPDNLNEGHYLKIAYMRATTTDREQPHGEVWSAARAKDYPERRFYWFESGDVISFVFAALATGAVYLNLDRYYDHKVMPSVQNQIMDTLTEQIMVTTSGYYALRFTTTAQDPVVGLITVSSLYVVTSDTWGHRSMPYIDANFGSVSGFRMTTTSMLWSNTAANLDLQGTITGWAAPADEEWYELIGSSDIKKRQGSFTKDLKTGMYAVLKPMQSTDLNFLIEFEYDKTLGLLDTFSPLAQNSSYLAFYANSNGADGRSGDWFITVGGEFRTGNQFFAVSEPYLTADQTAKALEEIRNMPMFYENPTHVSDILKGIYKGAKQGINWAIENGPKVLNTASALAKLMP